MVNRISNKFKWILFDGYYNRYAPETLKTSKYSHQSDVWSYGVTLIEMYTKPYSQPDLTGCNIVDADDILRRLENGERYVKKKI